MDRPVIHTAHIITKRVGVHGQSRRLTERHIETVPTRWWRGNTRPTDPSSCLLLGCEGTWLLVRCVCLAHQKHRHVCGKGTSHSSACVVRQSICVHQCSSSVRCLLLPYVLLYSSRTAAAAGDRAAQQTDRRFFGGVMLIVWYYVLLLYEYIRMREVVVTHSLSLIHI